MAASGTWTGARTTASPLPPTQRTAAAANYARANRQLLAEAAGYILLRIAGARLRLVYDVAHNLATLETHDADGVPVRV